MADTHAGGPITQKTIGLVGGGNMAKAIFHPLFKKGLLLPGKVEVSANSQETLNHWQNEGCQTKHKNVKVVEVAEIVVWAVKPQIFPAAVDSIKGGALKEDTLHISVMAGVTLKDFSSYLSQSGIKNFRAIRIMPNIGLQVSAGVAVYTCAPEATTEDKALVKNLFTPIGLVYEVQEPQMDAYGALFGCGIGFMFPIIEALSDGAVKMGIPRAISLDIAAQVLKGAGELYLKNKIHPAALKDMVCSPGGTTIAGVSVLERGNLRSTIMTALEASTLRGQELGRIAAASASKANTSQQKTTWS